MWVIRQDMDWACKIDSVGYIKTCVYLCVGWTAAQRGEG